MNNQSEQILNLLADQVTCDISHEDKIALAALLHRYPECDDESMELAAAAMDLAMTPPSTESMPDELLARIEADAKTYFDVLEEAGEPDNVVSMPSASKPEAAQSTPAPSTPFFAWAAAAVFLVTAIITWNKQPVVIKEAIPPDPVPTLAERVTDLRGQSGLQTLAMAATEDASATGASGELIWSADKQEGYMLITGLEANDPAVSQYQLWIFDEGKDDRYPIDGGVFDITGSGQVIVPIDAKIAANNPVLYAITVEKPGGVVVSGRERIVMLAQPTG